MLKYRDIKDALELYKMQEQNKILVDKLFFLSVLEEVVRNRRKAIAKSRQSGKVCTSK
ncbi:MAG: hypothetical protein ACI3WU_01925 [Phascolarctobacterium sp.]